MLQKYDIERDEALCKFDLERDEVLRKFIAGMLGVKLSDVPSKPSKQPTGQQKQTMTRNEIIRNYAK